MAVHILFMFPESKSILGRLFSFLAFNVLELTWCFDFYCAARGRTLEQMEEVFAGNAFTAWRVNDAVGKKSLADVEA